jgi:hypothetical protein
MVRLAILIGRLENVCLLQLQVEAETPTVHQLKPSRSQQDFIMVPKDTHFDVRANTE